MAIGSLTRQEIFEYLRPDELNALSESAETLNFKAGATVYHRGQKATCLYVVLSGQVALRIQKNGRLSILIDQLGVGDIFGSCASHAADSYALTAQCMEDSEVLRIEAVTLNKLLEKDLRMGYAIQSKISQVYFKRYVEAMEKLQAIVMNIPLESSS